MSGVSGPILLVGAGAMGGALIAGWRSSQAVRARDLVLIDPAPGREGRAACHEGARLNPGPDEIAEAPTIVLAVKPQAWRAAVGRIAPAFDPQAAVISVMAGVKVAAIREVVGERPVARVMPNAAAAICQGAAGLFGQDEGVCETARLLFEPLGVLVELREEALLDAVTAVAGSGPAYLYALIEALEAAGLKAGLEADASARLARATITGAAALLAHTGESAADLRRQVTSPGGTTQAALEVLLAAGGLPDLLERAVGAAVHRSIRLG